jgi:hypothetical protein
VPKWQNVKRWRAEQFAGISRRQDFQNRQSIITAAEKIFLERRVDAVGLTELAKVAGFTQGVATSISLRKMRW